jgi:hypothetical protein
MQFFCKKYAFFREKFAQFKKMQYLCARFRQLRIELHFIVASQLIFERTIALSNNFQYPIREARGFEDRGGIAAT